MHALKVAALSGFLALLALVAPVMAQQRNNNDKASRIVLKAVRVTETNKDGNSWDINNGKPDLVVRIRNLSDKTTKDFVTEEKQDTFEANFNQPTLLAVANQTLQIEVVDRDVAVEDLIGRKSIVLTPEMIRNGRAELTFDQVRTLTLEFQNP